MKSSVTLQRTILICADVGRAGRFLLQRRDLRLNWALTKAEAQASALASAPELIVARESFASVALRHPLSLFPCLVVSPGRADADRYLQEGAAGVADLVEPAEVLERVSQLTKMSFRRSPRVPFNDVVGVDTGGNYHFQETMELSESGLMMRAWEGAAIGVRVTVRFEMLSPSLELPAMVVRVNNRAHVATVGLAFEAMREEDKAVLGAFIQGLAGAVRLTLEPQGMSEDLSHWTPDLRPEEQDDEYYRAQLEALLRPKARRQQRLPRWLLQIAEQLSELERLALAGDDPTGFGSRAVDHRIVLGRTRAERGGANPSRDEAGRVMEFCRELAVGADGHKAEVLAQVASIRGDLLMAVYARPDPAACLGRASHAA